MSGTVARFPTSSSSGAGAAPQSAAKTSEITTNIPLDQQQERAVIQFATRAQEILYSSIQIRSSMQEIDMQYNREKNWTEAQLRARIANRVGDAHKMQDVTVPIVLPQVESSLTYLTNVFLTGYPLFGVASNPANEDAALMMETIIAENSITAGWVTEIKKFFRDGLKYNLCALEARWEQKTVWGVETDATKANSAASKKVTWNGNVLRRIDLYNAFWDYRVHPHEIADFGEFAGYTRLYSRSRMKQAINDMYGTISPELAKRAFESPVIQFNPMASGVAPFTYFQPLINPFPMSSPANSMQNFNWMSWALAQRDSNIDYKDAYTVTVCYGRIIPDDFGLGRKVPGGNTPQVWRFVIVNGNVVILAERMSNIHGKIPMFFGQPISDGLDYQTKSFAQNVVPFQELSSALWSGFLASKRRLVTDRVLYDPSRIRRGDINSSNPSAKIPVRPTAYGKPIAEAVYQFPFRDDQANSMVMASKEIISMANLVNNQNPAQQGQFVKGNKTLHEYEDVMGHGNGGNQGMAIELEAQVFTPIKEVIKLNILQFQQDGQIFNAEAQQTISVNQQTLRQTAVQFKVSDGLLPEDKEMGTEEYQSFMQLLMGAPQLAAGYNITPLLSYVMKLRGADLAPFEKSQEQQMYEQQLQQWQMAAQAAFKAGQEFKEPMPQPSAALQQEMQASKSTGGTNPASQAATSRALASTQGGS